jgi:WhiB family redox-sensing transcriptional regulator
LGRTAEDEQGVDWSQALCVGALRLFFPPDTEKVTQAWYEVPRSICGQCPIQPACLEYALKTESPRDRYGMWGGKTPRERRRLYKAWREAA